MAGSEFAKRQLKKHGWTEGSGLGKQQDGRSEPIKVSLKMDKAGVGHDPGKEFTDHWWLRVFNEAAQKIGVKKDVSSTSDDEKKAREKKKAEDKKNFYKGFVKSSTLTNGVETRDERSGSSSEEESDEDKKKSSKLPTLDDIHQFCGGATGHRAARFGIKMKGKLARVAEHDKLFEEKWRKETVVPNRVDLSKTDSSEDCSTDGTFQEKESQNMIDSDMTMNHSHSESNVRKRKKKKRKKEKERKEEELSSKIVNEVSYDSVQEMNGENETDEASCERRGKKAKKKKKHRQDDCVMTNGMDSSVITDNTVIVVDASDTFQESQETDRKRKKRKENIVDTVDHSENVQDDQVKQKRKKRKNVHEEEPHMAEGTVQKRKKQKKEH